MHTFRFGCCRSKKRSEIDFACYDSVIGFCLHIKRITETKTSSRHGFYESVVMTEMGSISFESGNQERKESRGRTERKAIKGKRREQEGGME